MKVVITGGLGHIGSYLVRELPRQMNVTEMVIIDNMLTQRYCSLFNLPQLGIYQFVENDVITMDLNLHLKDADVVIHLAAITDATASFDKKSEVETKNFEATKRVAEVCCRLKVPMIFASSTSVYGTQKEQVDENCSPEELKPQSPYAETKLREENYLQMLSAQRGLQVAICRLGTIFGASPGMRFHTAVNKFCWQAVMKQPLTVWSTAYHQKRPYLYLNDAARAMQHIVSKEMFQGEIYNVVSVNATVSDIVDVIKSHVSDLKVNFVDSKIMNQLSYEVLMTKLEATGFFSLGKLDLGVEETIEKLQYSNSLIEVNHV